MHWRSAVLAGALSVTISGCAVADPDTSQAVLRYSGGWFNSQAFDSCIGPGVRDVTSLGMQHFYYPQGQRRFVFGDEAGTDAPALQVSTKGTQPGAGGVKLAVAGTVTYRLNTSCEPYTEYKTVNGARVVDRVWPGGLFQRFHDTIGRHENAFAASGSEPQPPGWDNVVRTYVGGPIAKAASDQGLNYTWQELYSDPTKNAEWQKAVAAELPGLITQQAGADHFLVDNVQLLQPTLPAALNTEIDNLQAAGLRQATAATDRATANAFGGTAPYLDYLTRKAMVDAINAGKVRAIPVPFGSPVVINPGG